MLRFSYSDINKKSPSCRDCVKSCKSYILTFGCMNSDARRLFNPSVTGFPKHDFDRLKEQLSTAKCNARNIIDRHIRDSFVNSEKHATIEECEIFIDVINVFLKYIKDNKQIYLKRENMHALLATVLVVKNRKIISSSNDKYLNEKFKNYAKETGLKFTTDEPVFGLEDEIYGY